MLYAITISHQVGSGGAVLGQKLSERLGIPYVEREILKWVSEQLHLAEIEVEHRQERLSSFWQSFSSTVELFQPEKFLAADRYHPSDEDLFQMESEYIRRIAEKSSAIFLGRCCGYVLRDHPCHLNVLVYADLPMRVHRIKELYHLTEEEAKKTIQSSDRQRSAYIHNFTHQNCLDPRNYDLCVNTSTIGIDETTELVLASLKAKLNIP